MAMTKEQAVALASARLRLKQKQATDTDRQPPNYANDAKFDPTEGMSWAEKFVTGIDKTAADFGLGTKQLGALVGNTLGAVEDETVDALFAEQKARAARDRPLMGDGYGLAGSVFGNIAATAATGGLLRGAGAVPTIATKFPALGKLLTTSGTALMAPKTARQAIVAGGVLGALQPAESKTGKAGYAATGAGLSTAPIAIANLWNAAAKRAAALTVSGQVKNITEGMRVVLGDSYDDVVNALGKARAGATAGETEGAPFITALQRTAAQMYAPVQQRLSAVMKAADDDAIETLLNSIKGSSDDLIAARKQATKPLYEAVEGLDVPIDDTLRMMLKADPAVKGLDKAAQVARTRLAAQGIDPTGVTGIVPDNAVSIKGLPLMDLKKEMQANVPDGISEIAHKEWNAAYNNWLRGAFPQYKTADDLYAAMSKDVNRSQIIEELLRRSQRPGGGRIMPSSYLRSSESKTLPATATKWGSASWDDLTPAQRKAVDDVAMYAKGRQTLNEAGKIGGGSDTPQKLKIDAMLESGTLPPVLSNLLSAKTMGASKVGERWYQLKAQAKAGEALADLLADPALFAKELKRAKVPGDEAHSIITRLLAAPASGGALLYSAK